MNYSILKTILETSLSQYLCQWCQSKLEEQSVHIRSIAEGALDFSITCPHCNSETLMHAEIGAAQQNGFIHGSEKPIVKNLIEKNIHAIQESDIATIEKNLREKSSIEDLLN